MNLRTIDVLISLGRTRAWAASVAALEQERSPWRAAGCKYDVCRLSQAELRSLAGELYAGGVISFPDMRLLTLHPDTQNPNWPGWACFETSEQTGGRRNWIDEIEARLAKGHADLAYLDYLQRLLTFLGRVQSAREKYFAAQALPAVMPVESKRPRVFARLLSLPIFGRRARTLAA